MRAKEVLKSVRRTASPDYAIRSVKGTKPFEKPSDAKLVESFLHNKKIRLPFMVGMYLDKEKALSQKEKVGLLYFITLVMNIDKAIDESADFAIPLTKTDLVAQLSDQSVKDTDLTIAELKQETLEHFSKPKQVVVTDFLDAYIGVHINRGRMDLGTYSYDDALAYRKATNNPWVAATARLIDLSESPERIAKYQRFGMLSQLVDDVWDVFDDAQEGSQNLFLGLAGDIATEHPEELQALRRYLDTPQAQRPKQSIRSTKSWLRKNMPHTRAAYADKYQEILKQSHGLTKTIFVAAATTL